MKILLLTDYYPPESNAPALRCSYHAEYWAKKGHDVTVLTCAPNFPNGILFEGYKNKLMSTLSTSYSELSFCEGCVKTAQEGRGNRKKKSPKKKDLKRYDGGDENENYDRFDVCF